MTTIKLKHPITVDGVEVQQVTMRRPKVRNLERIDTVAGEVAKAVTLVADLTDLTPDQVREIDAEDFTKIADQLGDFLGAGLPTSGG